LTTPRHAAHYRSIAVSKVWNVAEPNDIAAVQLADTVIERTP
jgi:hypothetical protein